MDRETVAKTRLDLQDGAERIHARSAQLRVHRYRLCVCNCISTSAWYQVTPITHFPLSDLPNLPTERDDAVMKPCCSVE